jgi:hypothetical protein
MDGLGLATYGASKSAAWVLTNGLRSSSRNRTPRSSGCQFEETFVGACCAWRAPSRLGGSAFPSHRRSSRNCRSVPRDNDWLRLTSDDLQRSE